MYVGQTRETLEHRFSRHMGYQKDHNNSKFYRAVRKYGVDNFEIAPLEVVEDESLLDEREMYWIERLNTIENGYNTVLFAKGGDTLSHHPDLVSISKKISEKFSRGGNPNASPIMLKDIRTGYLHCFDGMKTCQEIMDIPRHDIVSRRCRHIITKPYRERFLFEYIAKCETTIERVANA